MNRTALFREEALTASRSTWLGEIIMIRPLAFDLLVAVAAGFAFIVAALLVFGSYTKRSNVSGQLMSDLGVMKIYPQQSGVILKKLVQEDQQVHQGDVLFIISSERQTANHSAVQQTISQQVAQRTQSLRDELAHTQRVQQDEQTALRQKVAVLLAEQDNISQQLASQRTRIDLAEQTRQRTAQLFEQGFLSKESMQQKQADVLEQRLRQQTLERDQITVRRELLAAQSDLNSMPLRHRNQLAQIERQLTNTEQEWTESEAKRHIAITAPDSGIATAITAEAGQNVDANKPLVSIIPAHAQLQAHLYAPSRAVGFIRKNDPVLLRYQAYPYQKFGHAQGTVMSVSQTALNPAELTGATATGDATEPLYRITVKLARQTVTAYGKQQTLQPGMQVEADVLLEQRKLYEWVLEPLYSLTGKL